MPPAPNFILARLYERQHACWHPLSWPQRLMAAPPATQKKLDAYAPAPSDATLTHKMLAGAAKASASPMAWALAAPVTALWLGGAAPMALAGTLCTAAGIVGTGDAAWLVPPADEAEAIQAPRAPGGLRHKILAYGIVGCATELLGASLGSLGAKLWEKPQAGILTEGFGLACASIGYTAALLTGAALTVPRLAVAAAYVFLTHAVLLTVSAAGAIGGLAQALRDLAVGPAPAPALSAQAS